MRQRLFVWMFFLTLGFITPHTCYAAQLYDTFYDQSEIEAMDQDIDEICGKYQTTQKISFREILSLLMEGNVDKAVALSIQQFYEALFSEILINKELIIRLLIIVVIAAIFRNYSSILKMSYVGEQGFYVTYLFIAVLLIQSFSLVYGIAEETIYYINDLMKCMLPAFYLSLMFCSGLTTSHMVNTMFLSMLVFVEEILLKIILPAIRIYFFITLLNQLNKEDRFSKLAGLLKQGIHFVLKTITTGIIGLNVVKSMLIPVYENAKYNVLQKGLSVIPGGSTLTGLSSILVGAGMLIKNSVGITVVLILIVCSGVPLLKMFAFYIVYKVITALVQPISDNRILTGIQGISDSTGILIRATSTSLVLSILSIAIVILTTNVR